MAEDFVKPGCVSVHVVRLDEEEPRYLLLRRCGRYLFGNWQMVSGKIEEGEKAYETALRELQEETGINKQKSDLIFDDLSHKFMIYSEWIDRYKEYTYSNKEYIFSLKLNDEVSVKLSREHSSYKWVDLNDAIHLVFSWTNKAALKAIPNFIY